jgi:TPR repeat protein
VPAVETVALAAPRSGGAEAPRPDTPVRALDREAIALLVQQGEQLISAGDIAAARTVYQRAAEAGDLAASVALAASYDPAALKQLGVVGMHADLKKARSLYEKAERLGSAEATRRLQMLARQ